MIIYVLLPAQNAPEYRSVSRILKMHKGAVFYHSDYCCGHKL